MANQGGIQLLPETRRRIDIKTPGENRWIYSGIAALVIIFSIAAGLAYYRSGLEDRLAGLDANLTNLDKQRDKKAEDNLLILSKQLSLTTSLLNNHIFWSKALAKVESLTQPQVQFSSFSATEADGIFQIRASTPNYTSLTRQLASYVADDSMKDIDLSEVHVLTDGRLDFTIRVTFDKNKLLKEQ